MVVLKSPKEVEKIHASNQIVAKILSVLESEVKPGVNTLYLNNLAEELTRKNEAKPAFKGYRGFHIRSALRLMKQLFTDFLLKGRLKRATF